MKHNYIKVVLLCQYWSNEMAEMVGGKHYFRELSPWIQETLNLFKNKNDVELHVVAPNYGTNKNETCKRYGIFFHFYQYAPVWLSEIAAPFIKLFIRHDETYKIAERLANTLTAFKIPAKNAAAIIKEIKPDLINLYGSENPDYASPAISLMNSYPILVTLQGFAYMQDSSKFFLEKIYYNYRVKFESYINKTVKYFALTQKCSIKELKDRHPNHFDNCEALYYVTAITKVPKVDASLLEKKYDLVFYARIDVNKGIEDLIEVLARLKANGREFKTLIMGRGSEPYIRYLKNNITRRELNNLICFAGYIENHDDVYKYAAQAKLLVLPTHNDVNPNSIREAMFMKLPVVANKVGGIPQFNQNKHCIHLVESGDLDGLANGICKVLDDVEYRNKLIENAHQEAIDVYSPAAIYEQTLQAYQDVYERTH